MDSLYCRTPKITMGNIEEMMLKRSVVEQQQPEVPFAKQMIGDHNRMLTLNYPRAGRYALFLNVQRDPNVDGA
jgi:hypothetical protein